jgi:hypothetical protein
MASENERLTLSAAVSLCLRQAQERHDSIDLRSDALVVIHAAPLRSENSWRAIRTTVAEVTRKPVPVDSRFALFTGASL